MRTIDHSLHGLLAVRLVGAPPAEVAALTWLLGPSEGVPGEPDVTVEYVADVGNREGLHYVGLNEAAYAEEGEFFLLDDKGRRSSLPLERLGEPLTVRCEAGASVLPYLFPILGLRLLRKGYVMLHASSFLYGGRGVLVTGWQKGGKTEVLLSYMAQGALYLGDEWTILSPAEGRMWGVQGTLQVWDWHLRSLPRYWGRIPSLQRQRLRLLGLYRRLYGLVPHPLRGMGPGGRFLERLSLEGGDARWGQARVRPQVLFGGRLWERAAPIDLVLLAGVGNRVGVSSVTPEEVARRMVASLAFERRELVTAYQHFRYAFPGRHSDLLETASGREEEALLKALQGRPAYALLHPYPVALDDLFEATRTMIDRVQAGAGSDPVLETRGVTLR